MFSTDRLKEILKKVSQTPKDSFQLVKYSHLYKSEDIENYGYKYRLNLFPIPKSWFPRIEYALGIKLTDQQNLKLNHPEYQVFHGRQQGQTLTHCILVALSIGEPLRLEVASDYGNGTLDYKLNHFMRAYQDVVKKLESGGFNTREVYYKNGSNTIKTGGWRVNK